MMLLSSSSVVNKTTMTTDHHHHNDYTFLLSPEPIKLLDIPQKQQQPSVSSYHQSPDTTSSATTIYEEYKAFPNIHLMDSDNDHDDPEKNHVIKLKEENSNASNINASSTAIFVTLRVVDDNLDASLDTPGVLQNHNNNHNSLHNHPIDSSESVWYYCYHMTAGSVPHSMVVGAVIGIVCGMLAFVYYKALQHLLELFWKVLPSKFIIPYVPDSYHWIWIVIMGYIMALGVGISVKYLGEPGDLSYTVQCVHDKGYIGMNHVLPMLCASQFSILGGGSLGPVAPLSTICASFGGFISRYIFQQDDVQYIRKHTLMGMSCALAAFFGVPLGGSLFALEINNRLGNEYYEHTIEAIYSGTICLCIFRALAKLDLGPIWQLSTSSLPTCTIEDVLGGSFLGLIGSGIAAMFSYFHQSIVMVQFGKWNLLQNNDVAIQRAVIGATFIILIGVLIPQTMFWGELEFQVLATLSPAKDLPHVYPTSGLLHFEMKSCWDCFLVGIMKMMAISFTVASGYRGGYIYPFFAAGAAFGQAVHLLLSPIKIIPIQLCVLCLAASINVAITRTSLATTLILTALSGELNAASPILASSIISLLLTQYMPFIRGQSKRKDIIRQSEYVENGPGRMKQRSVGYGSNISLR